MSTTIHDRKPGAGVVQTDFVKSGDKLPDVDSLQLIIDPVGILSDEDDGTDLVLQLNVDTGAVNGDIRPVDIGGDGIEILVLCQYDDDGTLLGCIPWPGG